MSISDQFWNSWNPSTNDLGAPVDVRLTNHGQQHEYAYRTTPFTIEIDQGTEISVIAGSLSDWSFVRWNWYGSAYYHTDSSWSTPVRGYKPQG